jgi:hypothetical protein
MGHAAAQKRRGSETMKMLTRGLLLGLMGAAGGYALLRGGRKEPEPEPVAKPARDPDAGPIHMRDGPYTWDRLDEALDETFPASDPPVLH